MEAEVREFLPSYSPPVQAIALHLRQLVLNTVPEAIEQIDPPGRLLGYGFEPTYKGAICVIMPLKNSVNFGFARGTELPDPAGLLVGTGKRARHVKVTTVEAASAPALRALLEAAIAQTRERLNH